MLAPNRGDIWLVDLGTRQTWSLATWTLVLGRGRSSFLVGPLAGLNKKEVRENAN